MPLIYKGKPEQGQLVVSTSFTFSQMREAISKPSGFWSLPEEHYYMTFNLWGHMTHDKFYGSKDYIGYWIASLLTTPVCGGYINTSFQPREGTNLFWEQESIFGIVKGSLDTEDPRAIKKFMKQVTKRYHHQALDAFDKGIFALDDALQKGRAL